MCAAAPAEAELSARSRKCNRSYAAAVMPSVLARLMLFVDDVARLITDTVALLAATTQHFVSGRSRPRPPHHVKPQLSCSHKG